jgi:hypothetical protein
METTEMTDTLNSINPTPHLCRSKVKQTALEIAAAIREEIRIHPSKGGTLL